MPGVQVYSGNFLTDRAGKYGATYHKRDAICLETQYYGWLDAETEEIVYNTNGMPDISANEMYHSATISGTIDTIPETPGLAVWHDGHIGVYIGNGEVVEAMGTRYGVVKTKLEGARCTHWLKIPYISYD